MVRATPKRTMIATDAPIETPCTRVCVVHPTLKLCLGCGRSIDEIARWTSYGVTERTRIMDELPARLAAINSAAAAPARA